MATAKSIVTGVVTAAVICGLGAGGWYYYKQHSAAGSDRTEKVYVQKVSAVNTVGGSNLYANDFAGVIVAQKTVDVKYDSSKTIDEMLVQEGDSVKKGDKLFTYSIEEIQLKIEEIKLDIERTQNSIETNKNEIASLEQEKKTATGDAQVSLTTRILSLQSDNARSEYEIKAKNAELAKQEKSLDSAFVTAPISGTVKDLKDLSTMQNDMYGSENPDVIMKISADGDFRVKGLFNEQNAAQIYQDAKVILKSRVDDTTWHGKVSEIDTSPQSNTNNMYYDSMGDEQTTSSKYAFYVEPESLEGFMLGQHILIQADNGQDEDKPKEGIWLYSQFVRWDGDKNYVWAKTSHDTIEKRYVEIGDVDDSYGDCQILSGLDTDDYIAYPADYIEQGMRTTTNQSDKDIPDNVGGEDMFGGMDPGMMFGDDGSYEDENISYDDDGNMIYTDEDGNEFKFDPEGNPIEDTDTESPDAEGADTGADTETDTGEDAAADDTAEQ